MNKARKIRRSDISVDLPPGLGVRFRRELEELISNQATLGFKGEYLKQEIFSKYLDNSANPPKERRDSAIAKWLGQEHRNALTNRRLLTADADFGWTTYDDLVVEIRRIIAQVLGSVSSCEELFVSFHTNGASTRVKRSSTASLEKLGGSARISSSALKHWFAAFSSTQISNQNLELDESSVLFTVPKKSDIDRVACKEPEANMLLQRSFGFAIRCRLKRFGIDLNDQTRNQRLAQTAVKQKLATIDLSSASDSITRQLVISLLPFDWWSLLEDVRVKSTLVDGELHELEMFSSMGNGFTFELESLIFYAITRAVCKLSRIRGTISVYGDDIIAPIAIVKRLSKIFAFFGFVMNPKKTHFSGDFRESCGAHYHRGFDVTPFYIKREVLTLPDLILHLNALLEWDGRGWGFFLTGDFLLFWLNYRQYVPRILWGGIDPSDPTCLVTGHAPRRRLVRITRDARFRPQAGLLHWFMVKRAHPLMDVCVDPQYEIGYKSVPVSACGERTSWLPDQLADFLIDT